MINAPSQLKETDAEERFVAWQYARYLRTQPLKLNISTDQEDRNVFRCKTIEAFESLYKEFVSAPDFKDINRQGHQYFSAGLAAYRRYVQYMEQNAELEMSDTPLLNTKKEKHINPAMAFIEPQRVDFSHPELCTGSDPVTCVVGGADFSGGNWRDVLVTLTEAFLRSRPKATELFHASLFPNGERAFLMKDRPKLAARQLSNGCWVSVHLSIRDLVFTIGKLCEFCGVDLNDVNITYIPKQSAE